MYFIIFMELILKQFMGMISLDSSDGLSMHKLSGIDFYLTLCKLLSHFKKSLGYFLQVIHAMLLPYQDLIGVYLNIFKTSE